MQFSMDFDDTNFIALVDAAKYKSFVDEDWNLDMLLRHFSNEMQIGNILVFQMTKEGIEHSWHVDANFGSEQKEQKCYRKAEGYIKVTDNQLYVVDYGCLTMAAQFATEKVPNDNCSKYKINIENGVYKVDIIQFYNADKDEYVGTDKIDILFDFAKAPYFERIVDKVIWCTF